MSLNQQWVLVIFSEKCLMKCVKILSFMALKSTIYQAELQSRFIPMLIFQFRDLRKITFKMAALMWRSAMFHSAIYRLRIMSIQQQNCMIISLQRLWIR